MRDVREVDVEELSETTPGGVPGVCALAAEAGTATTTDKTFADDENLGQGLQGFVGAGRTRHCFHSKLATQVYG